MRKFVHLLSVLSMLTVGAIALGPSEAEAKGIMIINTGEDFFEAGPLDELTNHEDPEMRKMKAGFKCHVFGVLWAYFHTWDCEPVIGYSDATSVTYINTPEAKALVTAKYSEKDMQMGVWARHGRWAFAGVIILPVLFSIIRRVAGSKNA